MFKFIINNSWNTCTYKSTTLTEAKKFAKEMSKRFGHIKIFIIKNKQNKLGYNQTSSYILEYNGIEFITI